MRRFYALFVLLMLCFVITGIVSVAQNSGKILNPVQKLSELEAPVVISILKDSKGFMWFLTTYGLVRYDGYNFKIYSNRPGDTTSIPNLSAMAFLTESQNGNIYLGTSQNLLIKFDPRLEIFESFRIDTSNSINFNTISALHTDGVGNIWLGTQNEGFCKYNVELNTFNSFRKQTTGFFDQNNFVTSFLDLNQDQLLVGTVEGLFLLNKQNNNLLAFPSGGELPEGFNKAEFPALYKDINGCVWIGTDIGLFKYDPATKKLNHFVHNPNDRGSLSGNSIINILSNPLDGGHSLWVLMESEINKVYINTEVVERYTNTNRLPKNISDSFIDESGLFWISSDNQGLFTIDLKSNPFTHCDVIDKGTAFSGTSFYKDSNGDFWVGTGLGGLFQYNASGQTIRHIKKFPDNILKSASLIYSMFEDSRKNFWIASWSKGLFRLDRSSGKIEKFQVLFPDALKTKTRVSEIIEDRHGRLWVGTSAGVYLAKLDKPGKLNFKHIEFPVLKTLFVRSICEDKSGKIWISTNNEGVFCLDIDTLDSITITHYHQALKNMGNLSSNTVFSVHCSDNGIVWVGTSNGLNRFNAESKTFDWLSFNDEFNAQFVFCIRSDKSNNLWVSTERGLARFNPDATAGKKFKLFSHKDGIPIEKIFPYHFDKVRDGMFYVGGERGFGLGYYSFHPDSIKENTNTPQIVITDFKIRNELVVLDTSISYKKYIYLNYNQNFLSFEFASLDYNDPDKNQYAYILEGVDDDWIYSGKRRFANYTGLSPGKYTFRVKGSNNDGYWNETGASLTINIATPPWKAWWAYLFYILFLIGLLTVIIRYYFRRQYLIRQLEVEQLESEKLKEVDHLKSKFFANISHEFRTPLTLIMGPLSNLLHRSKIAEDKDELSMIRRNTNRLLQMINQLLDLSKVEAGKMQLQCSEMNIVEWIRMYVQSFESLARQRKIAFTFKSEVDEINCFFDPEKMAQVLNNLLSNAFKFTEEGEINVKVGNQQSTISSRQSASTDDWRLKTGGLEKVQIKISDTGKGISSNNLEFIFNRFYQADDSKSRKYEGTGIGLALAKEIVELHGGNISAKSEINKGTTFIIVLPTGKNHLNPDDIVQEPVQFKDANIEDSVHLTEMEESADSLLTSENNNNSIMLIVEDNNDMRTYIRNYFGQDYNIYEAINGRVGFEKALKHIPDIIISDVMMPEMDGYELCQKIKSDHRTSHIPVVLLTARSSGADKIEGLETGADDFVIKPFEGKELQVRIKNLIDQRKLLREHFRNEFGLISPGQPIRFSSMENKFMKKAIEIVELQMHDPTFNVEEFARQMALSRVQLHRKIKAITDLSPGDFLRTIRLKTAAKMLEVKSGDVAEIAYAVGFNNPSWFAESFKKQFGVLPSEYLKK